MKAIDEEFIFRVVLISVKGLYLCFVVLRVRAFLVFGERRGEIFWLMGEHDIRVPRRA